MLVATALVLLQLWRVPEPGSGEVQPKALSLVEAMRAAYRSLRTLRCTEVEPARLPMDQRRVAYRNDGALLVQKLGPLGDKVVREVRRFEGRAVLSSPQNRGGYLWRRVDAKDETRPPWFERSWFDVAGDSAVVDLIRSVSTGEFASRAVSLRLEGRARLADGALVDRLAVDRIESDPSQHAPHPVAVRTVYDVRAEDRIVRRVETLSRALPREDGGAAFEFPASSRPRVEEFRDLVANGPIPDTAFRFAPEPGMRAVEDRVLDWRVGVAAGGAQRTMKAALRALRSLSFSTEATMSWTRQEPTGGTKDGRRRWLTRFDLARPGLARGERGTEDGPGTLSVVSDGERVSVRGGHLRSDAPDPNRAGLAERVETFDFRDETHGKGRLATALLHGFLQPEDPYAGREFDGFESAPPRRGGGMSLEVLVRTTEEKDEHGVPTGGFAVERYLLDPKDHLPRGYERDESSVWQGRRSTSTTRERVLRLTRDPKIDPSRFRVPGGPIPKEAIEDPSPKARPSKAPSWGVWPWADPSRRRDA